MTTEHCFQTKEKTLVRTEKDGNFYKLQVDGQLSNGVPFYKMDGYLESEILEIGDLFKTFKDIEKVYIDTPNLGAYKTNNSTTATLTDSNGRLTINGHMPAADSVGIRTDTFLMDRNRYIEWRATNTNRYLFIDLVPEGSTAGIARADSLFYMLNDNMVANVTYRIFLDMVSKMAYVYNGDNLVKSKSLSKFDFTKPHRLAIVSTSTRSHTMYFNYGREAFEYDIPSGYLALNEEGVDLDNIEIYTSTSMDGAIWEEYRHINDLGKIQSSVGKYFKVKLELKPFIEELNFKEYDYVTKDESNRARLVEGLEFATDGLTPIKKNRIVPSRYLDGQAVMYRIPIDNATFRVDRLDFAVEAVK